MFRQLHIQLPAPESIKHVRSTPKAKRLTWVLVLAASAAVFIAVGVSVRKPASQELASKEDLRPQGGTRKTDSPTAAARANSAASSEVSSSSGNIPTAEAAAPAYDTAAMDRVFASALTNANLDDRRLLLRGVAEFLGRNDPQKAQEYLALILRSNNGAPNSDAQVFTQEFSSALAPLNPEKLVAWSQSLPDGLKEISYQFAARHWAAADPKSAAQWIASLPDPALRTTGIRAMSQELAQSDPKGYAAQWAEGLARSVDGARFSDVVVKHWAPADLNAAIGWIGSLSAAEDRDRGFLAFSDVIASQNPTAAVAWAKNLPPGDLRNRAIVESVSKWANQDPAAAAAWVSGETSVPGLVDASIGSIASAWMRRDAVAAAKWIQDAPVNQLTKDYILSVSSHFRNP